jgi:Transposase zinc-ribbon domain/ISXO2-like transposase domain
MELQVTAEQRDFWRNIKRLLPLLQRIWHNLFNYLAKWSKVMQQKALSLMQFRKMFGTEKACQKHLFRLRWPEGFRCPRCQHGEAYFHRTRHLYPGKEAPKVLPWVHTLIANMKGNIRGIHHGVSPKNLPRYLAEFCYRFNRRFWELQMFNRMLHACLNSTTVTFSELKA